MLGDIDVKFKFIQKMLDFKFQFHKSYSEFLKIPIGFFKVKNAPNKDDEYCDALTKLEVKNFFIMGMDNVILLNRQI